MVDHKHQAVAQIGENEMVVAELGFLEEDAKVYKLIGPILVQQDLVEVKANVSTRIDFIRKDLERVEKQIKEYERKGDEQRQKVRARAAASGRPPRRSRPRAGTRSAPPSRPPHPLCPWPVDRDAPRARR